MVWESERLYARRLTPEDYRECCALLQDAGVMYAYEHAFSDAEVQEWLDRQIARYAADGFGLWALVRREDGAGSGQAGLTMQECGGKRLPEIGYLLKKAFWHQGYATEAAMACKAYAFGVLGLDVVYSIIRDNNFPSQRVAQRNGMVPVGRTVKHYYHMDMPHILYAVRAGDTAGETAKGS